MKRWCVFFFTVITMFFSATCFAGLNDYPTVAVVKFENKAAIPNDLDTGDLSMAADLLTDELLASGMFDVVERDQLKAVLDEQYLGGTGLMDNTTAVKIGNLVGAQYVVIGSIANLSASRSISGFGTTGIGTIGTTKNSVNCNVLARMIDVATGRVVLAGRGAGKSSRAGVELGFIQSRRHYDHHHYVATHMIRIGSDEVNGQMVYNALEKAVMNLVDGKTGMLSRLKGHGKRKR